MGKREEDEDRVEAEGERPGKGVGEGTGKPFVPEFEIVDEGQQAVGKGEAIDKDDKSGYSDDERLSADQRTDAGEDDDATDTQVDQGNLTAEQIAAKRERRRKEKKQRRERQRVEQARTQRELHFLRLRNEQLEKQGERVNDVEKRVAQSELVAIDGRLEQIKALRTQTDEQLAKALDDQNGAESVRLTRMAEELRDGAARLANYRRTLEKEIEQAGTGAGDEGADAGAQDRGGQDRRPRIDPVAANNLKIFMTRHDWVDPEGGDEDSQIVMALDRAVKKEGFNPATREYWTELEKRMERRLPERMKDFKAASGRQEEDDDDDDDQDDPPQRRNGSGKKPPPKGGPRMPAGGQSRGSGKQFILSAERKQALIEAGVWDDPEARDRHIRSFAKWDAENRPNNR